MLTSTHYNNEDTRLSAGTHGLGAKLTAIFSKWFSIETVDSNEGKKFVQVFEDNLSKKSKPKITSFKGKPYTKVSFIPDYERFGLEGLDKGNFEIMWRRAFDVSAVTPKNVTISFNGDKIPIKTFEGFVDLFVGNKDETARVTHSCKRWEVIVTPAINESFHQISFVNGVFTSHGGKHVDYIQSQIVKSVLEKLKKKFKDTKLQDAYIREQMWLFIKSDIENASFSSQTKEELTTRKEAFGSTCDLPDTFIKKVIDKLDISSHVASIVESKGLKEIQKSESAKKNLKIPKLDDANKAGTKESHKCTLILTEGDSAKTFAVSGLSVIGRDYYGVFPLRGKFLNVRDAPKSTIVNNKEFINLKQILGLQTGKEYKSLEGSGLRYGSIMICTDADVDGSHIKGLIINMLEYFWPSLFRMDGFIKSMSTPVVKASKKGKVIEFYSLVTYEKWKASNSTDGWNIKYYKGLGTSSAAEAKEYFKELAKNTVSYEYNGEKSTAAMNLAFNKDSGAADKRKLWLKKYDRDVFNDTDKRTITFNEFVNNELIHFSNYDIIRSIPSVMDGLKPSQRKILYCAFLRNLVKEIKVAQFSGYVSEKSSYHHGEASLQGAIIGMAQDFVGSNNLNLLLPNGQFGTRLLGGKDASSPRYIFTQLAPYTHNIFPKEDFPLLNYLNDDGYTIEPEYYFPVIPMILVNGAEGIGTGYSTAIPSYNPIDVIQSVRSYIKDEKPKKLVPWYRGFEGNIIKLDSKQYLCKGIYKVDDSKTVTVTSLPVGRWTEEYKAYLIGLTEPKEVGPKKKKVPPILHNIKNYSTENTVKITIRFKEPIIANLEAEIDSEGINDLEKLLKLTKTISLTNMHAYSPSNEIIRYNSPEAIIEDFYPARLQMYIDRRKYQLNRLKLEKDILDAKVKFVFEHIEKKISIINKSKKEVDKLLSDRKYPKYNRRDLLKENIEAANNDDNEEESEEEKSDRNYDYLTDMKIHTLTKEKAEQLKNMANNKDAEYKILKKKSEYDLWNEDLDRLEKLLS